MELQSKYFDLKKKLSSLNYTSSFGIDSFETIEQLYEDLVSTTDSYRQLQDRESRLANDVVELKQQLFPLRKENSRLSKEIAQFRLEKEAINSSYLNSLEQQKKVVRIMTEKFEDLEQLSQQKDISLASMESRCNGIYRAFEKLLSETSSTSYNLRVKRFKDISYVLPRSEPIHDSRLDNDSSKDSTSDFLHDFKLISTLRQQVEAADSSLQQVQEENERLKLILKNRSEEFIQNGEAFYDSSQNTTNSGEDTVRRVDESTQRIIEQLHSQIDFLNAQLAEAERRSTTRAQSDMDAEALRQECAFRGKQLEDVQIQYATLGSRLQQLEQQVQELVQITDISQRFEDIVRSESTTRVGESQTDSVQAMSQVHRGRRLAEELERLQAVVQHGSTRDDVVRRRLSLLEEKLAEKSQENGVLQEQLRVLSKELEQRNDQLRQYEGRVDNYCEALDRLQLNFSEAEKAAYDLRAENANFVSAYNESKSQNEHLNGMLEEKCDDFNELKRTHAELQHSYDDISIRCNRLEAEVIACKQVIQKAEKDVSNSRSDFIRLKLQYDTLSNDLAIEKDHSQRLQESESSLSSKLTEVTAALDELSRVNGDLSLRLQSGRTDVLADLQDQLKEAKSRCMTLEDELISMRSENQRLHRQSQLLTSRESWSHQHISELTQQVEQANARVAERDEHLTSLRREVHTLEMRIEKMSLELSQQGESYLSLASSGDLAHSQLNAKNEMIAQLQSENNLLQMRLQETQESISKLQETARESNAHVTKIKEQLRGYEKTASELTSKCSDMRAERERCETDCETLRRQNDQLHRKSANDGDVIQRLTTEKDAQVVKIQELKTLILSLESSSQSHNYTVSRFQSALEEQNESYQKLKNEYMQMEDAIKGKAVRIEALEHSIQVLDSDRDNIQHQLDLEVEDKFAAGKQYAHLQQLHEQLRHDAHALEQKLIVAQNDIASQAQQIEVCNGRINALHQENKELRHLANQRALEVGGVTRDIQLMTRENQALTTELADATSECSRLQHRLQDVSNRVGDLEQEKRALEVERADLLQAYRTVLTEKRRVDADLESIGESKLRFGLTIQQLEVQVIDLRGQLQSHAQNSNRWGSERAELGRQLMDLNDRLVRVREEADTYSSDLRRSLNECNVLRQNNSALSERCQLLSQRAASALDSVRLLTSRVSSAERDRDTLRELLLAERQRTANFEGIQRVLRLGSRAVAVDTTTLQESAFAPGNPAFGTPIVVPTGIDADDKSTTNIKDDTVVRDAKSSSIDRAQATLESLQQTSFRQRFEASRANDVTRHMVDDARMTPQPSDPMAATRGRSPAACKSQPEQISPEEDSAPRPSSAQYRSEIQYVQTTTRFSSGSSLRTDLVSSLLGLSGVSEESLLTEASA